MGPELLARLAQIEHVEGVKQSNADELQLIDGLDAVHRRRRHLRAARSTSGGAGGICVASHIVGDEMRRMVR